MLGWFQALMPQGRAVLRAVRPARRHRASPAPRLCADCSRAATGSSIICKQIFEREAEADEVTRQVLTAVRRTFITPFDRTDIQDLIIVDGRRHRPDEQDRQDHHAVRGQAASSRRCSEMGEIIVQAAKLVLEAVPLLSSIGSNAGRLNALTEKIIARRGAGRRGLRPRAARRCSWPAGKDTRTLRQRHELHRRRRALRSSGKGRRPLRGRLERNKLASSSIICDDRAVGDCDASSS